MTKKDPVRLHVIINGRVQGVGFRYFVYDQAHAAGLNGWVRNRWDGSVEVLVEGTRADLDQLLGALRRGPRSAMVMGIHPNWSDATGEFGNFIILPTTT